MSNEIREFDGNNNRIYYKSSIGAGEWWEYDKDNNKIYYNRGNKYKNWWKYNKNNDVIYYLELLCDDDLWYESWFKYNYEANIGYKKDSGGKESWYRILPNRIIESISKKEYEKYEEKEYLSRKKCSRFEIMEI